jgi:hypothetical protein
VSLEHRRGIGDSYRKTAAFEHRQINQVVTEKRRLFLRKAQISKQGVESRAFVAHALFYVPYAEVGGAFPHAASLPAGNYCKFDTRVLQQFHAHAVAYVESLHGVAGFGIVQSAVGQNAIDIEYCDPDLPGLRNHRLARRC